MAFNIDEFMATGAQLGFTRPSYFMAAFQAPPAFASGDLRFLSYLCSGANLPGVQIITQDGKTTGYGPTQKFPFDVLHSDVTLTFYSDGSGDVIAFFDQWMRNIVSFGMPGTPISGANQGDVQYPSNYQTRLQLFQYNDNAGEDEIEVINYTLDNCYPTSVSDIGCDWSSGNEIQRVQVTFAFRNFWIQQNEVAPPGSSIPLAFNSGYYESIAGAIGNALTRSQGAAGITPGIIGLVASSILGQLGISGDVSQALNTVNRLGQTLSNPVNLAQSIQSFF